MKRRVLLQIPEPCQEAWADMTPQGNGRHCSACAKTVVDFSGLSDAQILTLLQKAGSGALCGRFDNAQLNRQLTPPPERNRGMAWFQKIAASLILTQAFISQAFSQERSGGIETEQLPAAKTGTIRITGRVLDHLTLEPVAHARLRLTLPDPTLTFDTVTDLQGRFTLQLPRPMLTPGTLTIAPLEEELIVGTIPESYIIGVTMPVADVIAGKEIILYRYTAEKLPDVALKVKRRVIPLIRDREDDRIFIQGMIVRSDQVTLPKNVYHPNNPADQHTKIKEDVLSVPAQDARSGANPSFRQRLGHLFRFNRKSR